MTGWELINSKCLKWCEGCVPRDQIPVFIRCKGGYALIEKECGMRAAKSRSREPGGIEDSME